jgi:hypothetical protein
MSEKSQSQHLDSTIESLEKEVDNETTRGAQTSITSWIKTLSEHEELKGIADDLQSLKEAISAGEGKKIVELMTKLGKETTAAAGKAEGAEADKIKKLGSVLTASAKAIGKLTK